MLESSNGTGKFASVHVEVTFRSITGIPVYVIQEALADNNINPVTFYYRLKAILQRNLSHFKVSQTHKSLPS